MRRILLLVLAAGTAVAEDLDSLTEKLRSPDPAAREAALLAIGRLGRYGIPAAPAVRAALEDADLRVRAAAAEALWWTSSHVQPLLSLFRTDAEEHARFACRRVGPDMLPALESAYRSRDVDRRIVLDAAFATLGRSVLGRESRRASWKARKEVAPAIERGLAWLANNQESDGSWGSVRHGGWPQYGIGITALGALAFLGCHEDPANCEPLRKALSFLASVQKEDGHFGPADYERHLSAHAFATLAFAEAALLCGEPSDRAVLARAVPVLILMRNAPLGWRYTTDGDCDTQVTCAVTTALFRAAEAGMPVDPAVFDGARTWLEKMTDPEYGRVGYNQMGGASTRYTRPEDKFNPASRWPLERTECMTAVGVTARTLLGDDRKSPIVQKGVELILAVPPRWEPDEGYVDYYYWYHAALLLGPENLGASASPAAKWMAALRGAALAGQDEDGSWPPVDQWGYMAGRVYSTAMMTLALEGPILYGDETADRARVVTFLKMGLRAGKETAAHARELVKSLDR